MNPPRGSRFSDLFTNIFTSVKVRTVRSAVPQQHYSDVIMSPMASQITSLTIVYSTVQIFLKKWRFVKILLICEKLETFGAKARIFRHYNDVIMTAMVSQITGVSIGCSTVCSGADQRKHQSSASLAFVRGIHRWPVNSPHKWPVTRKMFPFDDVIVNIVKKQAATVQKCILRFMWNLKSIIYDTSISDL